MSTPPENTVAAEPKKNGTEHYLRPAASVTSTDDGYVVTIDLPGVRKSELEINLENGELAITGRRSHWPVDSNLVHRESASGEFRRVFELDPAIDGSKIAAKLEDGVLTVQLPKGEQARARRIEIAA
jgi:HSP20 family protein